MWLLSVAKKEVRGGSWVSGEPRQRHPSIKGSQCVPPGERGQIGVGEKGPGPRDHPHPSQVQPKASGWAGRAPGCFQSPPGEVEVGPGCREVLERLGFVFQDLPILPL